MERMSLSIGKIIIIHHGGNSTINNIGILEILVIVFTTGYQSKAGYLEFSMLNLPSNQERLLALLSELHSGLSGLYLLPIQVLCWSMEG